MVTRIIKGLAAVMLLSVSTQMLAQDAEEPPEGWRGAGELGYVKTSGNTDTSSLNLALEFIYEQEKWRHTLGGSMLKSSKDGTTDADRWTARGQSDYKFSEKSYIFASVRHDADKFSGYNPVTSFSAGYGRQLVDTEKQYLLAEIGAGYRLQKVALTGEKEDGAILRGRVDYRWTISESTEFGNLFLVEYGSDNTYLQNDTSLTVAINKAFGVKLGYQYRHNTKPPLGSDATDQQFTTNLVYNFE
jgi:putative salt-induced outer membrane protein